MYLQISLQADRRHNRPQYQVHNPQCSLQHNLLHSLHRFLLLSHLHSQRYSLQVAHLLSLRLNPRQSLQDSHLLSLVLSLRLNPRQFLQLNHLYNRARNRQQGLLLNPLVFPLVNPLCILVRNPLHNLL